MRAAARAALAGLGLAGLLAVPGEAAVPGRLLVFNDQNVGARVIVDGAAPVDILPHKFAYWTVSAGPHRITTISRSGYQQTFAANLGDSGAYLVPGKGFQAWCRTTTGIQFSTPACEQRYKESFPYGG